MDKLHRRELKHDKFVEEVGHTLEYAAEHRSQFIRYGSIALAVIVAAAAIYFWRSYQHDKRQAELREVLRVQESQVSPQTSEFFVTFPTAEARAAAVEKAWKEFAAKHDGSDEGAIASFYLGTAYADKGNVAEAEKQFRKVVENGSKPYASQAKLSLAELYAAGGRTADAEKLLKELMANPTIMVSKEQATIAMARLKARTNPEEARKLLEPLRTETGAVSRMALTALSELPAAR